MQRLSLRRQCLPLRTVNLCAIPEVMGGPVAEGLRTGSGQMDFYTFAGGGDVEHGPAHGLVRERPL